jgi:hypothetical protein
VTQSDFDSDKTRLRGSAVEGAVVRSPADEATKLRRGPADTLIRVRPGGQTASATSLSQTEFGPGYRPYGIHVLRTTIAALRLRN